MICQIYLLKYKQLIILSEITFLVTTKNETLIKYRYACLYLTSLRIMFTCMRRHDNAFVNSKQRFQPLEGLCMQRESRHF